MEPGVPPGHPEPFHFQPKKLDDNAVSGSVGLVFSPIGDLHLTANVATGYREPNAQDLFFSGPGTVGFVVGNPDLKPERSVSYDAGVRCVRATSRSRGTSSCPRSRTSSTPCP